MTDNYPRVLVVSHNVFSAVGNMGKTMASLLEVLPDENLAQLYFHSEIPTVECCKRYFRITDTEVLRSVFTRKTGGRTFTEKDIRKDGGSGRTDTGLTAKVYQAARRRTPLIYIMRDIMWKIGKWRSGEMYKWIKDFSPEVLFFASGDYSFSYRIACCISDDFNIPIVMWCCDDYYINTSEKASLLGRIHYANRWKWARRVVQRASSMVVISDKMNNDYSRLFDVPIETLHIAVDENNHKLPVSERKGIYYIGNLGLSRHVPLLELAKVLKEANIPDYDRIHVYSGEKRSEILNLLTAENGVEFHGAAQPAEIEKILGSAMFLLYVEALDEKYRARTRYSLSTKIGESLKSGACVIAYGPSDISSMEYLRENEAARVIENADEVASAVSELLNDKELYNKYIRTADELAKKQHNRVQNNEKILMLLKKAKGEFDA